MVVTGNFDDWAQTQGVLTKDPDSGAFEAVLRFHKLHKLVFKFVVNGEWVTDSSHKIEHDEHGNPNNYIDAADLTEVQEFTKEATPEAQSAATIAPVKLAATEQPPVPVPAAASTQSHNKAGDAGEAAVSLPIKLVLESHDGENKLTNVLTSDSSYAAVSIPGSGLSAYENISHDEEADADADADASNGSARNRTAPEEVTPTNSNSGVSAPGLVHSKQQASGSGDAADSEVTTLGPNSRNNSFTGRLNQPDGENVDVLKVPGSFPSPAKSADKTAASHSRRDGLITRLKGLFRS